MIPLYDTIRTRSFPFINLLLIAANISVFLLEITTGPRGLRELFAHYAVIPAGVGPAFRDGVQLNRRELEVVLPLFTSMFLHGGWLHVGGNMLYLYIFGDNIEDRLGHFRFLLFYLLCGIGAGVAHILTNWGSSVPTVGASGAIAGVLGAYLIFYPGAYVASVVFFGFFWRTIYIPASVFLIFWFLMQTFNGMAALAASHAVGGVAWWAHIGGFILGMVLGPLLAKRWRNDEYEVIQRQRF